VLLVIFLLLYMTYGSLLDAAQVLLAVPFGLAGGVYLLYALGYNFSVAVWLGSSRSSGPRSDRRGDGDLPGRGGGAQREELAAD